MLVEWVIFKLGLLYLGRVILEDLRVEPGSGWSLRRGGASAEDDAVESTHFFSLGDLIFVIWRTVIVGGFHVCPGGWQPNFNTNRRVSFLGKENMLELFL